MKYRKYFQYAVSAGIALAIGGLSAIFTVKGMPYYQQQLKPWFTPPAALFPIVWSILYILMGVGAARIWKSSAAGRSAALRIYAVQLMVNFFWSVIFFGLHWYFAAFLWLLLLIILILAMMRAFAPIDRCAARLQIPYLIWCCFAAVLNATIWLLN